MILQPLFGNIGATCIGYNFYHQEPTLALVTNFATLWCPLHYLQIWSASGATCILINFTNLATKLHNLHLLQIWPPSGTTCISCKLDHPVATHWFQSWSSAGINCIVTLPWITLSASSAIVELVSTRSLSQSLTSGPEDRTPGIPGSDTNVFNGKLFLPNRVLLESISPEIILDHN